MHEFSITCSLVEAVLDLAKKQNSRQVLEVHLRIGKLRVLSSEQVEFSYSILAKGTILEGSRLVVEESNGVVQCNGCGYRKDFPVEDDMAYHFGVPPLTCPQCGKSLTIEGGDECTITKVRMLIPSASSQSEENQ